MDIATGQSSLVFVLAFVRIGAFFMTAPVFSLRVIPVVVKTGFAGLCAYLVSRQITPGPELTAQGGWWIVLLAKEVVIGAVLGYIASLGLLAAQAAGAYISIQAGFNQDQIIDPRIPTATGHIESLYNLLAGFVFFLSGAYLLFLSAVFDSFTIVKVGSVDLGLRSPEQVVNILGGVVVLALRMAFPVVATLLLAEFGLGLLSRLIPQLTVFSLGLPLKILLLIGTLGLVLPSSAALLGAIWRGLYIEDGTLLRLLGH